MNLYKEIKKSNKRVGRLWCWCSKLKVEKKERKLNLKETLTFFQLMTFLEPLHVSPYFRGDHRIIHKIELSPHSHYIIMTNKNEMIQNIEEEIIIIKYRWHTHNKAIPVLLDSLRYSSKTKRRSERKQE